MGTVSFPHPVLLHHAEPDLQDIQGDFSPRVSRVHVGPQNVVLELEQLYVDNSTITDLIAAGSAQIVVEITCRHTYYRSIHRPKGDEATISLDATELMEEVVVQIRVAATRSIEWRPEGLHDDYGSAVFNLESGDVLAMAKEAFRFRVTADYDPLRAPGPSLMKINRGRRKHGPFEVNLASDYIEIVLSHADHDEYALMKERVPALLAPLLALPALAEAIRAYRSEPDEYGSYRWFGRLGDILAAHDIASDTAALQAAQVILEAPMHRGLRDFNQYLVAET